MPRGDLKEPAGKGHGTKRGLSSGGGGKFQARGSAKPAEDSNKFLCICRSCGFSELYDGSPHAQRRCPNCGGLMTRQ